ncbi:MULTISPECIES: quinolinate synthase NadA [Cloacibacterium]|uniref:Quinolinate synthase n=1 Tax=Cloacibacterium normanense TaxID=237258 RepID=A0A1E5UD03_9FLAO|nr:quinolinate synthase NadA [Cloacibacterium normanense]AZI70710.1 quinolinate synthase NadA [Cloacibacterium normanense]OEL10688.1 quinolinate synthetase complex, A subunit [Cloacibacterium normanense]PPZ90722.1 quinolinate synthase NadA [Cloacibacterium normanense]SDO63040.1 quinolinate synthetase [Cloacibacterium normanense]
MEQALDIAKNNLPVKGFLDLKDIQIPQGQDLIDAILKLKKEKNAVILAHYYQPGEIQDIADYLGDSLQLARAAKDTDADMIAFCGVHFMAEAAKILNPTKKVVLPDTLAGCSLADGCSGEGLRKMREQHPGALVATYINCNAETKAESDIIVTSSNAETIINALPKDQPIIFAPDKNLGRYLMKKTGRDMILWDGSCIVHEAFSMERIAKQLAENPDAKLIAHPESETPVLELAHFIGSTSALLNYVEKDDCQKFIIATEEGILHEMKKRAPHKELIPALVFDESCNCSECFFMKRNTLEKLYLCMKYELPEITMDEELRLKALKPIEAMLELSKTIK